MNWEKLELHLENLIPGIVVISIIIFSLPDGKEINTAIKDSQTIAAIAFIAAAYMMGSITNIISRLLLDPLCRRTARPLLFRIVLGEELPQGLSSAEINKTFAKVLRVGLACGIPMIETEVAKRRQTGRLIRTTLTPSFLLATTWIWRSGLTLSHLLWVLPILYLLTITLYAYAEAAIYQEAHIGYSIKEIENAENT